MKSISTNLQCSNMQFPFYELATLSIAIKINHDDVLDFCNI